MYGEKFEFDEVASALKDLKAVQRWSFWVQAQVRVGIELEKAGSLHYPVTGSAESMLRSRNRWDTFVRALEPSGSYDRLSKYNVVSVTEDGSVNGDGVEVLVVGTNEDFVTAYERMSGLQKVISEWGLKADKSCGMHYHLLAAQDDIMPEVILKNFYQLTRRYYSAILYLTSTNGNSEGITRSSDMHFFQPTHLRVSPLGKHMREIKEEAFARDNHSSRYVAFNMGLNDGSRKDLLQFQRNDIKRFHVEFRFPDASDSPAQIVSQMFLFRALLMKAVELSRFGVIRISDNDGNWTKNKEAVKRLAARRSDSTLSWEQAIEFAQNDARNLLKALRPILMNIDGASLGILSNMVEKPVWQRRAGRQSWAAIEKQLLPKARELDEVAEKVLKVITLQQVTGHKQMSNWKAAAATFIGVPQNMVINALRQLGSEVRLDYDIEIGTYTVAW